jgi:hypothetical protein
MSLGADFMRAHYINMLPEVSHPPCASWNLQLLPLLQLNAYSIYVSGFWPET